MLRCGILLDDDYLIERAKKQISYVIRNADEDGYLGPEHLKDGGKNRDRWAHAVFLRSLMALYSATGEDRILEAVKNHYLSETSDHSEVREVCNLEEMCWVYSEAGDERLLEMALEAYEEFNRKYSSREKFPYTAKEGKCDVTKDALLSGEKPHIHGVTYNEMAKLPAILYMYTGESEFLEASLNAYEKLDRDHMLVPGVNSSNEYLAGKSPLASYETCDIADFIWSSGYLLMASGEAKFADKMERAAFNAAPGSVKNDFKSLQYFSCPNQVIATGNSDHNEYKKGSARMAYRPNHDTECCPGQVNRVMPNFIRRMWLSDGSGGLVAALYGPSRVNAEVGEKGKSVTIVENTDYPFSERIEFQIRTEDEANFTLWLRVPGWCDDAELFINGDKADRKTVPGSFLPIDRKFEHNDRVTLNLPMNPQLDHSPERGSSILMGPLVYSIPVQEKWERRDGDPRSSRNLPAWNVYPDGPWNYALAVDGENLEKEIEIEHRSKSTDPWTADSAPIALKVPVKRIDGWHLKRKETIKRGYSWKNQKEVEGNFVFTPPLPEKKELSKRMSDEKELITFLPYGCTHLRMTILPQE
ncbi:hypothetical protein AKJ65_05085 [candidate division MSBL1 archaeon SCGC-AAA259E19]|uniref:Glycosyl hydrolase n=1 Tax=candidate division MSBL1 archaeon SCGC-AAA259E19 TaxID=1698264 RepID=A0A133UIY5_9EURY|nr:hypothetical protein AKJ65_05085 [candidate division MSBL1 archaeon SCGC-AAA259E19]